MEEAQDQMQQGGIMGDAVTHYQKHIYPSTAIAFCCTIEHAKAVSKAFTDAGISSTPLTGDNCKDRKDIIKKLGTGEIKVVTSCQIEMGIRFPYYAHKSRKKWGLLSHKKQARG